MSRHYREAVLEPLDDCIEENEIPGYPGYYATEEGAILRRIQRADESDVETAKRVKTHIGDRSGHLNVRIHGNPGEAKEPYVHRLVAKTHIPNRENHPIVRHLDDVPSNNSVDNLAWGTQKDNMHDCVRNGHFKNFTPADREKSYEKSRRPVWAEKDGKRTVYRSISEAKRDTGAKNANKVLSGERTESLGYTFGYLDDD